MSLADEVSTVSLSLALSESTKLIKGDGESTKLSSEGRLGQELSLVECSARFWILVGPLSELCCGFPQTKSLLASVGLPGNLYLRTDEF